MTNIMQFNTKEDFDSVISSGVVLQVWNARSDRWISIKDISKVYHPYNRFRVATVQEVNFKCCPFKLSASYHVDTPLSQIKKDAKKFAGYQGLRGVWSRYDDEYSFKAIGKTERLTILFKK